MAIANRIAVLNKGQIEQIGSPQELYRTPKTFFVACFIGRPQINVLPEESGVIRCVRPENIKPSDSGIEFKVLYSEWLGNNQLFMLDTPKGVIRMMCSVNTDINSKKYINWSSRDEHKFDLSTKKRIL